MWLAKVVSLDLQNLSPDEKRRYKRDLAIEELIITEKEYLEDLKILVSVSGVKLGG